MSQPSLEKLEDLIGRVPDPSEDRRALTAIRDSASVARRLATQLHAHTVWRELPLRELLPGLSLVDASSFQVGFDARAANALTRADVRSWAALGDLIPQDLLPLPGVGAEAREEILLGAVREWAAAYLDAAGQTSKDAPGGRSRQRRLMGLIGRAPDPLADGELLSVLRDPANVDAQWLIERLHTDSELRYSPLRELMPGVGLAGGMEARQSYDPWGVQLSGPSLEMGYLGAWERPTDPTSDLIQMGARTYDPSLGGFLSEDPVFGHLGIGASVDRYLYVRDNPLNYYDLNGRETCVSTPVGSVCPVKGIEDIGGGAGLAWHGIEEAGNGVGSSAGHAWNWTAPSRSWVANQAQDFWKQYGTTLEGLYRFAGENWQTCIEGGSAGAAAGFVLGTPAPVIGNTAGAAIGGVGGCAGLVGAKVGISSLGE